MSGEPVPSRPRVVVVTTWLPTTISPTTGVFVRRDIEALASVTNLRVIHLVSPSLHGEETRSHIVGTPVLRIPMAPSDPLSVLRALPALRAAMQGADVLHSMAVSSLVPLALLRPRLPWVHTEHWSAFARPATGIRGFGLHTVSRIERLPDVVAAVSPDLARTLERLSGRNVVVVPNIVAGPAPTRRRDWSLNETLEVISVGGLIPRKEPELAVRNAAELIRRGAHVHLTWVGEGPLRRQISEEAAGLGVPLTLTGALSPEDVPARLAQADLFLGPSRAETFFLAAAEALAAGRPVVVGDSGGPRAFVRPPAGRLVESNDPRDFADAIEQVMADTRGVEAIRIARSVADFTPEALASRYLRLHSMAAAQRHQSVSWADHLSWAGG